VVPYQTSDLKGELKTADIAKTARGFTMLISCTATESAKTAKN
jgi:hypothetical protein